MFCTVSGNLLAWMNGNIQKKTRIFRERYETFSRKEKNVFGTIPMYLKDKDCFAHVIDSYSRSLKLPMFREERNHVSAWIILLFKPSLFSRIKVFIRNSCMAFHARCAILAKFNLTNLLLNLQSNHSREVSWSTRDFTGVTRFASRDTFYSTPRCERDRVFGLPACRNSPLHSTQLDIQLLIYELIIILFIIYIIVNDIYTRMMIDK